jgi:hypothetical protein
MLASNENEEIVIDANGLERLAKDVGIDPGYYF